MVLCSNQKPGRQVSFLELLQERNRKGERVKEAVKEGGVKAK
jgi:hypothetical protein